MKKLLMAAFAAIVSAAMCGCMVNLPEGYSEVKAAKEKYNSLDSGNTIMTDLTTNEQIMDFSFLINPNNEMVFSYYGKDGQDEFYAYSDGAQYFYKEAGKELWSVIPTTDESYIYNLYNRENRYPYADGGIFFLDGASVETAEISESSGITTIKYVYNADKLNQSAAGFLEDVSSFSALETTFVIDENGYITEFIENGTVTDSEGKTTDVNLKIKVMKMNEVYDIPYPVDQLDKSGG